jgi:hypothetical protein
LLERARRLLEQVECGVGRGNPGFGDDLVVGVYRHTEHLRAPNVDPEGEPAARSGHVADPPARP